MSNVLARLRCLLACCALLVVVSMIGPLAYAEEEKTDSEQWRFRFAPYLWIMGLSGDATVKGNKANIDASFGDILENSDSVFGLQGLLEVWKGRWGAFVDGTYLNLGVDDATMPTPGPGGPIILDAELEAGIVNFGGAFQFADGQWGETGDYASGPLGGRWSMDVLAGGRFTTLTQTFAFKQGPPPLPMNAEGTQSWTDPIIGLRALTDLTKSRRWNLELYGDIGGFGVASDFTWQFLGVVGYKFKLFKADGAVLAGYRALYQDYETGSGPNKFAWDMTMHGPLVGLGIGW